MLGSTGQVFCGGPFIGICLIFFLMIRQRLWPLRIKHEVSFHSYHIHFVQLVTHLSLLEC